jgi:hypothetical protein
MIGRGAQQRRGETSQFVVNTEPTGEPPDGAKQAALKQERHTR